MSILSIHLKVLSARKLTCQLFHLPSLNDCLHSKIAMCKKFNVKLALLKIMEFLLRTYVKCLMALRIVH